MEGPSVAILITIIAGSMMGGGIAMAIFALLFYIWTNKRDD